MGHAMGIQMCCSPLLLSKRQLTISYNFDKTFAVNSETEKSNKDNSLNHEVQVTFCTLER